jgi:hypothetical protein
MESTRRLSSQPGHCSVTRSAMNLTPWPALSRRREAKPNQGRHHRAGNLRLPVPSSPRLRPTRQRLLRRRPRDRPTVHDREPATHLLPARKGMVGVPRPDLGRRRRIRARQPLGPPRPRAPRAPAVKPRGRQRLTTSRDSTHARGRQIPNVITARAQNAEYGRAGARVISFRTSAQMIHGVRSGG